MKELKFRAIIPERNAIIYFTLKDLLQDKFSNREILWKYLEEGNQPDLFIGMKDKNNREIYENDIVKLQKAEGVVEFREDYGRWDVSPLPPANCYFVMWEGDWSEVEIIGYRHYNLLWKRWEVNYSMPKER